MSKVFSIDFLIVPPEKAVVSVMDRGFLYGDSVYEVVRTYDRTVPFFIDRHFERLQRSAARIGLTVPFTQEKVTSHLIECVRQSGNGDSYVRIIVSRGEDYRFHLFPEVEKLQPRTIIMVDEIPTYPADHYENGIGIALVSVRRNLPSAVDPNIKSGNYLNNMLAMIEAKQKNAVDAVMLNYQGFVTEGTTSNVFMVEKGVVVTPEVKSGLLEGISRSLLVQIMERENIPHRQDAISRDRFLAADEIFLTGTTKEIMPVTKVDGRAVGDGRPGATTRSLMTKYHAEVQRIVSEERSRLGL